MPIDRNASWIWISPSRTFNTYACFRRVLEVKGIATSAIVRITADSRYELFINGQWLGHGPIRSFPNPWPVDEYDIAHLLRPGKNLVAVLVHHFGISTFQYLHSPPGLIAEVAWKDSGGAHAIVTDPAWRAIEHQGYGWPVPRISCQQGWEEQFDARLAPGAPEEWTALDFDDRKWRRARVVQSDHRSFEPRAIPFLSREVIQPVAVRSVETVRPAPYTFNLNPRLYLNKTDRSANHLRGRMLLVSWIHSPGAQKIQLHPPHIRPVPKWKLNGKELAFSDKSLQHTDTGVAHARLHKGANCLMCHLPETEHLFWATINLWTDTPVTFSSSPIANRKAQIANSPFLAFGPFKSTRQHVFDTIVVDPDEIDPNASTERFDAAWSRGDLTPDDLAQPFARPLTADMVTTDDVYGICASERPDSRAAVRVNDPDALLHDTPDWTIVHPSRANVRMLLDFGKELIGYHEFALDAPAGTILDFHNFEFIQRDGRHNLCEGMNNSFRYICREGGQRYRTFIRRGFRYSWMTLRNFKKPVRIRFVRVLMCTYPMQITGSFACSDAMLNEIWKVGVHSVRCCAEDTYTDCPTYEQTFWVGDARNEALVDLVASGDPRLSAHCLRLAGRSLERSVITESQVPSGWQNLLTTWSFLWMRWAQEHYLLTGDESFAREMIGYLERNIRGVESHINERGLFQLHAWNLFDWAGMDCPAAGTVTHVNCFAVLALRQCADLAMRLGERSKARHWNNLADSISSAINKRLWSPTKQAYVDCIRPDGTLSPIFSQQTQTAAYVSGVATRDRARRCLAIIDSPPRGFIKAGSPFFMFFLLEALVREKRFDSLVRTIRDYWGKQIDAGATTFWEMYHEGQERLTRSHCHGWSAAPTVFLSQYVLGIRPAAPGYQTVLVAPQPGPLTWAHGRVPTPRGPVECYWKRDKYAFSLRVSAPTDLPLRIELPYHGRIEAQEGRIRHGIQSSILHGSGPLVKLSVRQRFPSRDSPL